MLVEVSVRRLTRLLAASVAISWIGIQISAALAGVVVLEMTGNLQLVGLPYFLVNLGSALAAYPAGHLMDHYGRRPVLVGGHVLAASGFAVGGVGLLVNELWLFLAGVAISALGAGATYLVRLAAAELYPIEQRGRGLSLVVVAATVGAVLGTPTILLAQEVEAALNVSYLLVAWGIALVLSAFAAMILFRLRPDTKEVALAMPAAPQLSHPVAAVLPGTIRARHALVSAGACLALAQATMVFVMASVSGHLQHIHFSPGVIGFTMTAHIVGMFLFSPIIGHVADRVGRKTVLIASAITLIGACGALAWRDLGNGIVIALFVVGLGWSLAFMGSSILIADASHASRRGRATAVVDTFTAVMAAAASLTTGLALNAGGGSMIVVGRVAVALSVGVLLAALLSPARRATPTIAPPRATPSPVPSPAAVGPSPTPTPVPEGQG